MEKNSYGGKILADCLKDLGVSTVFTVPGESFLAALNGLYDHKNDINVITCRHESGAANMAEAWGKLNGLPGVVFVTRGRCMSCKYRCSYSNARFKPYDYVYRPNKFKT